MRRAAIGATLALAGCTGDGSDIGPDVPPLPEGSFYVTVRHDAETDDTPLGVSSAVIAVGGATGATGRSGRVDVRAVVSGVQIVRVDASHASARDGDLLAGYSLAVDTSSAPEMPFVVFLPDLSTSVATMLASGTSPGVVHDDSGASGAVVTIAAGAVVDLGGAAQVELRTGSLAVEHVPGRVVPEAAGAPLTTRAIYVSPEVAGFTPSAGLAVPNDFALPPGASAELRWLDPLTGVWTEVADAVVDGAGAVVSTTGGVARGGLYCFATTVGTTATVTGRVLDPDGIALPDVLVRTGQAWTSSAGDGTWSLQGIAAVDGQGQPRTVRVELHGGRELRPVRASTDVALAPGLVDAGDLELDSGRVFRVRGLMISRGRIDPREFVAFSSADGASGIQNVSDADALFDFDDLDSNDRIGWVLTRPDPTFDPRVITSEGLLFVNTSSRTIDQRLFFGEQDWVFGTDGDTLTWTLDRIGTGFVDGAHVCRDLGNGYEFLRTTDDGQVFSVYFGGTNGEAVASIATNRDGRSAVSAFSIRAATASRAELPLLRANRSPNGNFDPYALVSGSLAPIGDTRRVRVRRSESFEVWLDRLVGVPSTPGSVPVLLDPEVSGGLDFVVGVPTPAGTIAAVAGTTSGSVFTLEQLWFEDNVVLETGSRNPLALGAGFAADTGYVVSGALTGVDAAVQANLQFDLGASLAGGGFVDCVSGVGGNHTVAGSDVTLRLPALTAGALAGGQWDVWFGGEAAAAGVTTSQRALIPLTASAGASSSFHGVPEITSPAPGAVVSAAGFDVEFTAPVGAAYTTITLHNETTNEVRDWTVLMPPNQRRFSFRTLPDPAPTPLAPGDWTLTVASARIQTGPLTRVEAPYARLAARWVGISAADREVDAVSSSSISVTLQ